MRTPEFDHFMARASFATFTATGNGRGHAYFEVVFEGPIVKRSAAVPAAAPIEDMPAEATQAHRFGKAREARSAAQGEDYVELIADLHVVHGEARASDIAKRLGVTHPTALKTLNRLKREGLVTARPYRGVFLTSAGSELAERVRARHRLMVELLRAVGVPSDVAETDAEGMEHHASSVTLDAFASFLRTRKS